MAFFSSKSSETGSSRASAKKVDNRTTTADTAPTTEERFTDSSVASRSSGTRDSPGDVSSKNPTKLFDFVTKRNWAGAVKRCKGEDKKEASQWIVEHNKDGTIRWKLLPIHQACENKAPSEVIKALIAAYPESLMMKDSGGYSPLHLACRERSSKTVIAALLTTEPGAAKIKDDEGRLPLHLACRQGVAVQVVESLIVCHYRAARTPDSYNLLPIHWACAQNANVGIVESLLRANPDALDHKDKWGRTPLALAEASTNPEKDGVLTALKREPSYWTTTLVEEIDNLKKKVERSSNEENKISSKVEDLQRENAMLKEQVVDITSRNKYSDEDISKVNDENSALATEIGDLKKKLNEFTFIFRGMEEQRKALIKITKDMETSLQQAVDVAGDDYLDWDPLRSSSEKSEPRYS